MDFAALPPEINSGRMYAGPGAGPMLTASAAWDTLAADLHATAALYGSVISGLTGGPWLGPASASMAAAAAPYVAWLHTIAGQAEHAATQAKAAAAAYETAFATTVPPPVIAANRSLLMSLIATNILGQNTPAIAVTEAHYGEMWAQDAAAMYGYADQSVAASTLSPFTPPALTTNPGGIVGQAAAVAQAVGAATGTHAQTIISSGPQLMSTVPQALQGLAQPLQAADPSYLLQLLSLLTPFTLAASSAGAAGAYTGVGGAYGGLGYAAYYEPQSAGKLDTILNRLGPASGSGSGTGALVSSNAAGLGAAGDAPAVSAGTGRAASVGALSVPQGWATAAPAVRPVAAVLPTTSLSAVPTVVAGSPGGLFSEMALASMAGRAMGGTTSRGGPGQTIIVIQHPTAAG